MDYKVDFTLKDSMHATPFVAALMNKDNVLNKNILEAFLKKGHNIDEYHDSGPPITALLRACSTGNLEEVKILLELKANPCAIHRIYPLITSPSICLITTPLLVAIHANHTLVVKELFKYPIPPKEISTAMHGCQSTEMEEILKNALPIGSCYLHIEIN